MKWNWRGRPTLPLSLSILTAAFRCGAVGDTPAFPSRTGELARLVKAPEKENRCSRVAAKDESHHQPNKPQHQGRMEVGHWAEPSAGGKKVLVRRARRGEVLSFCLYPPPGGTTLDDQRGFLEHGFNRNSLFAGDRSPPAGLPLTRTAPGPYRRRPTAKKEPREGGDELHKRHCPTPLRLDNDIVVVASSRTHPREKKGGRKGEGLHSLVRPFPFPQRLRAHGRAWVEKPLEHRNFVSPSIFLDYFLK